MLSLEGVRLERGGHVLARDLDLRLGEPGLTVLQGANGSGKSSLLRLLKGLLPPAGGRRVLSSGLEEARIGLLLPDPQNQLLSDTVLGELSLPLRYRRLPREQILARCESLGRELDLLDHFSTDARTLSGGLQQLVCLGAILIQEPRILLLDEVCTFLDPAHRERLARVVAARAGHTAVLQVSHREDETRRARRCLELGPTGIRSVEPGERDPADHTAMIGPWIPLEHPHPGGPAGPPVLAVEGLCFRWSDRKSNLFNNLNDRLPLGGGCLLTGSQGQGKSTLILLAAGLLDCRSGRIGLEGAPGQALPLFQFAEKQFTGDVLREELLEGGIASSTDLDRLWRDAGLDPGLLDQPSRTLSGGEGRLAALVSLLLQRPAALLLDEPFTGLDTRGLIRMRRLLADWRDGGGGLLLATHDPELARDLCASHRELRDGCLLEAD